MKTTHTRPVPDPAARLLFDCIAKMDPDTLERFMREQVEAQQRLNALAESLRDPDQMEQA